MPQGRARWGLDGRHLRVARVAGPQGVYSALISSDGLRALPVDPSRFPWLRAPSIDSERGLDELRLLAPVLPGKIAAIGRNYAAHAAELGNKVPSRPLLFLKAPSSVVGPAEPILLPPDSQRVEHEAELALVIGRTCRHVRPEEAESVVAGYTILNDVTARDLQRSDGQFARGKGFDTFCPVGPWVETELDWRDRAVRCRVWDADGQEELRQDGRTAQMIFDVPTLVAAVSRVMTLHAGDLIATGTPSGVGLLRHGDVVEVEVEGIGRLRNPVARDEGVPAMPAPIAQS